ncbi:Uncharacterized protein SCF082_LOCUS45611, partial [Durusdinium trenchii]
PDLAVSNAEEDTQPVEFDLTLPEDPEALRQMKALPMSPAPPTPVKVDSPPDPIAPVDQETQEVPSALEDAPNKPAELGSSSQRVMPAAPMSQDQEGGMKEVAVVNSATHRKEYMRLKRMMEGQRGLGFPHMKRLFDSDNRVEKQQLLQTWVNQGENAEACEGYLVMRATQQHKGESKQELLTVRAVRAMGLSEPKIEAVVRRGGGVVDPEVPTSLDDVAYWVTVSRTRTKTETMERTTELHGSVDANDAMAAFHGADSRIERLTGLPSSSGSVAPTQDALLNFVKES